ncbi:MAG: c-type cytochrome biogenesis protein CcmI [Pseudomonadales bacterium]|nr:c-type cytochrome biogenesis protein CcmI [Pseudomonadales bacterium]
MSFYLGALVLGLLACAFVLLPLLRRSEQAGDLERKALNVALYREHVSELASEEDSEELALEAQKVLLSETLADEVSVTRSQGTRNVFLVSAVLLPLFAALIYMDFGFGQGAIGDVALTQQFESVTLDDRIAYRRFVGQVERRASQRPEDPDLQFLLARAYLNIEAYAESAEVMSGLVKQFPGDHNLLSQYAEVLYLKAGRRVDSAVDRAIEAALRLNPHDVSMMEIRAIGAMQEGDQQTALGWFQKALATGITGQRAELIRRAVERIGAVEATTIDAPLTGRSLTVVVSKPDGLEVSQSSMVFVYARAVDGPPAPLAVQRFPVARLPVEIILDETMAMVPGMSLATFDEVIVIARISQSGQVAPAPGDYEARSGVLNLSGEIEPVVLDIAQMISE